MSNRPNKKHTSASSGAISRRNFLRTMGIVVTGSLLVSCAPQTSPSTAASASTSLPAATATATTSPTATATSAPLATSTVAPFLPRPQVALAQANSYDRKLIRKQVQTLLDGLGGVKDIVGRGDKVVIKVNLSGGTRYLPKGGELPIEYHVTHPEVVRAISELLLDAGAKSLYIVESFSDTQSVSQWGYTDVARSLNAALIDLNQAAPYPDFATVPVGANYYFYENLLLNHILEEASCLVSIAKMKPHCSAGVTLSMKNLVGIGPLQFYRQASQDGSRTAFHGSEKGTNTRLPRVIVDLNRARPIHLAVLDGISTIEGGEGPWTIYTKQIKPGVLLAGKNALATDAVATSVMGFDPTSEAPAAPFLQSDNYLNLAYQQGLGTNRLDAIDTIGVKPADVRFVFAACMEW